MSIVSHLHQLFNTETCHSYILIRTHKGMRAEVKKKKGRPF